MKLNVLHVLPTGGANPLLKSLLDTPSADFAVAAFGGDCEGVAKQCDDQGVEFMSLGEAADPVRDARAISRAVGALQPDAIEAHSFRTSVAASIYASAGRGRRPSVVAVRHHNLNHHLCSQSRAVLADKFVNRCVDGIIAVSHAVRDTLVAEGARAGSIYTVYNGLPIDRPLSVPSASEWPSSRGTIRLLAIGRLDWQKDYPNLLRALALMRESGADAFLRILGVGQPDYSRQLKNLTVQLGVSSFVTFAGWQANPGRELAGTDVFVHAAKDEAFGMVLLEAMAECTPVVATGVGGAREVVGPFYRTAPPSDSKAFADLCLNMADRLDEANGRALAVREEALARFSAADMAEGHLNACRAVLRERHSARRP